MSFFEILQVFLPLVLILVLLFGVLYWVKRYTFSINNKKMGNLNISVLSSQMIMPKKFISVVRVQNRLLILGVSEHSITLLKEMENELPESTSSTSQDGQNSFLDMLRKNIGLR